MRVFLALFMLSLTLFGAQFIDLLDRKVELQKSPKSFVAIGPGALRLAVYLGLNDKLIGIEATEANSIAMVPYRNSISREKIESLPKIGQGGPGVMPNLEALATLKPDVIIASFFDKATLDMIEAKTSIPVVAVSYGSGYGGNADKFTDVKNSIKLLGSIFDKKIVANSILIFMDRESALLRNELKLRPSVYIAGIGFKGAQGFFSSEGDYLPFEMLGLKNSVTSQSGHVSLQKESVLSVNPEYIFIDKMGEKIINEEMRKDKSYFDKLKAFQEGRVKTLPPYNFYNTNIENCFINAYIIKNSLQGKALNRKYLVQIVKAFYRVNSDKVLESIEKIISEAK